MLLAFLMLLSGGAGALYSQGYWDTWEDRRDELKAELIATMESVPEAAKEPLAECLTNMSLNAAAQLECSLANEPSLIEQLTSCADAVGQRQALGFGVFACIMQVQAQLGEAEQETP